jgi:2-aminoadipate transaminase
MLDALAEFFPREAEWTQPSGGLFIWATLPDFIDTGDLLAKALREERVAFVPGSAAYVDGRGGSSMRLNFSGADVDGIVEGVRRIGKVVDEQISLFSTFAGPERREPETQNVPEDAAPLADVVELPRRGGERRAQGS